MKSIVYVGGLAAVIGLIYPVENSISAEVSCGTTLYFCSYNSDDIITVTTSEPSGFAPLQGFGVYLNNSQAIVNDITINTSGSTSDAIRTNSERTMFVADRLTIRASGNSADGINLSSNFNNDADALAYVKSFADIQVSSGIAVRANNFQNSGANSVIILPDGTRVSQNGTGAADNYFEGLGYGVYAGNRDRDTNGLGTIEIIFGANNNTLGNSYVFLGNNSTITTSMTNGHAVYANKGGLIQLGDGVSVSTTGSNAYALYASREQQGSYTDNVRPGYIYLGGGATLRAGNSAIVMQAKGEGSVIANKVMDVPVITDSHDRNDRVLGLDKDQTRETSGLFDIIGILDAVDGGAIALNMTSGSSFIGSTNVNLNAVFASDIMLNIAGVNSVWKMDTDSSLTGLTLSDSAVFTPYSATNALTNFTLTGDVINNGGIIDLAGISNLVGDILTIKGAYSSSNGYVWINTALGDDESETDLLRIDGDISSGAVGAVKVFNVGGTGAQTVEGIKIIEVTGASDGTFSLDGDYVYEGQQAVVGGAYAYKLYQGSVSTPTDGDWYLRSQLIEDEPEDPLYQAGVPVYEAYPQALLGLNGVSTLQQRVGNRIWTGNGNRVVAQGADAIGSPYATPDEAGNAIKSNGVWGRIEGSHNHMEPRFSTSDTNYNQNVFKMQAGIDGLLAETENGKLVGGFTVHYAHGKTKTNSAHGDGDISTDGYGLGGTLTWYGENGFYLDGQGQVTWYRSDLNSTTAQTTLIDGNHGFGYALSLESGKRLAINEAWSLTPQAQLTYSNVDFDAFKDVFDVDVSLDRGESLQGRLGLTLDHENSWQNANGMLDRTHVYGIANLYYEFLNGTRVSVAETSFSSRNDRVWGGLGLGGSYNWNDDKYSIYGEGVVNTSLNNFGDSYSVKGNVGFRLKW